MAILLILTKIFLRRWKIFIIGKIFFMMLRSDFFVQISMTSLGLFMHENF